MPEILLVAAVTYGNFQCMVCNSSHSQSILNGLDYIKSLWYVFFFSMKHACGDGGYLLTSTMIYHFLENDSFFLPGIIFGVAVTSPNACNSGKAFSRQGHPLFPSLKMHYVYYYLVKGEEELPALWRACPLSSETFSPSSPACAEVWKVGSWSEAALHKCRNILFTQL